MAIWYCDPRSSGSGNDNYSGSDTTLLSSGTDGVTNGTNTFTSASASWTSALVGQYINIAGTQRQITAVGSATSLTFSGATIASGSGKSYWIGGPKASPNQFTTTIGVASGDTVRLPDTGGNVRVQDSSGTNLNATFTNLSDTITLSAAATADVNQCEGSWTSDAASTVCSTSATNKSGTVSSQFVVTSGSGLLAHIASTTVNLSAYSKVSLWIRTSSATTTLQVRLCSDSAGAVPVHTITIGATTTNNWKNVTWDNSGALSSTINSISVYATGSTSTTVLLDCIIACNRLTLGSLITKDASGLSDGWYPIKSINGTTVKLDYGTNTLAGTTTRGYYGTTETVAVYAVNPSTVTFTTAQSLSTTLTITGGWNFGTKTQTGFTALDITDGSVGVLSLTGNSTVVDSLIVVRTANNGILFSSGSGVGFTGTCGAIGATTSGVTLSNVNNPSIAGTVFCVGCSTGINMSGSHGMTGNGAIVSVGNASNGISNFGTNHMFAGAINVHNNASSGIATAPTGLAHSYVATVAAYNNATFGIAASGGGSLTVGAYASSGNGTGSVSAAAGAGIIIQSGTIAEATVASITNDGSGAFVTIQKFNGTATDSRTYKALGTIQTDTTTRHTASGVSWKLSPNSVATSAIPLKFGLQPVAVDTTSTTRNIWTQRDSTNCVQSWVAPMGNVPGVSSDVVASGSAAINTWEQLTVTFTATDNGGMRYELRAHGSGTNGTNCYFDDVS